MPKFGTKSLERRELLCKDLKRLVDEVIKVYDVSIVESHRTKEEQEHAYKMGNSKAHFGESAHNYLPSFAVDLYPYPVPQKNVKGTIQIDSDSKVWNDMVAIVKKSASKLGIEITCGAEFKTLRDMPHFEIKHWKEIVKEI